MGTSCSLSVGQQKIGPVIVAATPDRRDDVLTVLGAKGDAARCQCQWFRLRNAEYRASTVDDRRDALCEQLAGPVPPGVVGYDDTGTPVGWCAVAPRADYPRLDTAVLARATDEVAGLWVVSCFVVRVGSRRQGMSAELLDGAVELARQHGATVLEAYPVDLAVQSVSSAELYHGALSTFLGAGFSEVARPKPSRPTVRLTL